MMSDCKRYASPSDICLVEHPKGVFCKYDDVKKLEAENKALREAVKSAYIEGWSEGHNQGIGCGHALAPRCRHKASIEWCESEAAETLAKLLEEK